MFGFVDLLASHDRGAGVERRQSDVINTSVKKEQATAVTAFAFQRIPSHGIAMARNLESLEGSAMLLTTHCFTR